MAIDHSHLKLGKRPRRHDPRTLRLAHYLTPALPSAPLAVDYTRGVTDWGMMLNDHLGDCIIADGPGHATQVWTLNATGAMVTPPDSLILETYEKWCGYNPADPSTDQGGVELDVLKDWRQKGFAGHALDAYVAVDLESDVQSPKSEARGPMSEAQCSVPATSDSLSTQHPTPIPDVATAIWLFGGAYIGVELPLTARRQAVWDVPANPGPDDRPGSWGGHAIYLVAYDFQDSGLGKEDSESRIPNSESHVANSGSRIPNSEPRIPNSESRAANSASRVPYPVSRIAYPGTLTCITWGRLKKMTWAWFSKYCSEAYALVSKDWIEASGVAPSGFDLATLEKDLENLASDIHSL